MRHGDFLDLEYHARRMLIEQIIHCSYGDKARREELDNMSNAQLREEWNHIIGEPAEQAGI